MSEACDYPDCNCPFDMGPDNLCLRGLPSESSASPACSTAPRTERESELLDALATLCSCKRYKDKNGKTAEYESAKDRAWKRAFELTGL